MKKKLRKSTTTLPQTVQPVQPRQPSFPVVGIGASAGGLAAFEAFFSGMPVDTNLGMAFVLVQHLAPDHKSMLTELIQRYTRMQVFEVEDGMQVAVNCVYIIPPNRDMAYLNGRLLLMKPTAPRGQRLPIDFFFCSLAQDQRERAIGIVPTGTGSDGTQGIRAIKGEGGMVMVQRLDSTEHDAMPRNALATGMVDFELPPAEMPAQLIAYAAHAFGMPPRDTAAPELGTGHALQKIFLLLRDQTGHDFSSYKPSSIHRRIKRRMALHQIETIDDYIRYLQQAPDEVTALFRDLLIGVTNFFRDPDAFNVLKHQAIPQLFADKPAGATIRVWVPGCSTGEEAYSIAILLQEQQESLQQSYKVQIFATDIDSRAIAAARIGLYPAGIAIDVTPERLARFFTLEDNGSYLVNKNIRDLLVFSEQDVIRDPPFSRIDLISCRNLLIYLNSDQQKRLIHLFHYALNPGGFLFLGTSETVGDMEDLFAVRHRQSRLYQHKRDLHGMHRLTLNQFLPNMTTDPVHPQSAGPKNPFPQKRLVRELTERTILQQVAPACVLVNDQGDILYIHGRTGMYLEPTSGEAGNNNIIKMSREGLQHELTTSLHKVVQGKKTERCPGLLVKTNGDSALVNLTIRPVFAGTATVEQFLYLVILEQAPSSVDYDQLRQRSRLTFGDPDTADPDIEARIAALKQELRMKEEYLQTSNEELKSANEEMQSINEELQSTNEEMETSREELQSVNSCSRFEGVAF
ncbi:CheR family methyltransferase [Desulfobulbus alkaliphilus]|uniref:CheR family methyltransferase n=1 Tax=Desulfobulbus alkaliphilus TaxID=869814 RepID=UPI00196656D7|nr:CheR family methyltransferase [Desulfobulbus alkaliphilus]MBM9538627.1 chemotaxis protein CheR [Desulfobulbus alkaliphilus]